MAVFVDLDEEDDSPIPQQQYTYNQSIRGKPEWNGGRASQTTPAVVAPQQGAEVDVKEPNELSSSTTASSQYTFRNAMTEALGCYP